MGGCFSDVKGGQQAVSAEAPTAASAGGAAAQQELNDAVGYFLHSRGLRGLVTALELSLSASKLRNLDVLSKSDPLAVLYAKKHDGMLEEVGRTEVVMNNLSPAWITKFTVNYQFEIVQQLVIRVYDVDTKYHNVPVKALNLNEQDFLGEASCTISEIVTKPNRSLTLNLQQKIGHSGSYSGTVTLHAEETVTSRIAAEIIFRCSKLENKDVFSKSDPFLRISKVAESGISVPICKTEVINNNVNPVWKSLTLSMQQFGSKENPLIIECFNFNVIGKHDHLGMLQTSIAELEKHGREKTGAHFYVQSASRPDIKKVLKGQLFVESFIEKTQHSFLDYISSGFELNFMIAIDFTASNGDPRLPSSLHFIDPSGRLNSYQQAIMGVGEVIQFYDSDRKFPAWGFGGRISYGSVSHCFNLNGSLEESEVLGVEGIMSAYAMALHNVALSGPTLFGPVINKAADIASRSLSTCPNKYYVLLIITDGVITDLQETKDAIVKASDLPMSILIVGVGGADYKEMEILDADNGKRLESSTDRVATRDIVQFVPMRDMQGSQVSVVQSLLEELPGQFLSYMRCRDIKPLAARAAGPSAPPLF
ncbi:protein BONZAI 3 isoform X1 [Canna indica]|uniref:Protein BONZAI 3 isoform X1 n=1 Tax=Canna indica TaxID=4628 RepID=A0AAQ3Q2J7_9LILI|nr:protein BONZAI 3 isoform X1 [Canna indica]